MLKKSIIVLCAVLVLSLLIGCSADSIVSLGRKLGKLSDATLVPRNSYYVEKATENVEAFIEESEKVFVLGEAPSSYEDPPYDRGWTFKGDDKEARKESIKIYLDTVEETVNLLLSARDSSANDKALRNALNAEYAGKAKDVVPYKNIYEGLRRENFLGSIVRHFGEVDKEEHRANLVMILMFLGIKADKDMIKSLEDGVQKVKSFNLPIPLQSCDYSIIIRTILEDGKITSIVDAVKAITKPDPGEKPKLDMEVLKQFVKDVEKRVGDREYQTVGDKIAVGIVYSIIYAISDVDEGFRKDPEYFDPEGKPDYKRFFDYVFATDSGKAYVDKIFSYFEALSYIYDSKLDLAGFVAGVSLTNTDPMLPEPVDTAFATLLPAALISTWE